MKNLNFLPPLNFLGQPPLPRNSKIGVGEASRVGRRNELEARDFNGGPLAWFNYASYAVLTLLCIPNSLGWSHITEATQPQRRRVAKKTRWHAKWRKSGSQSEFFPTCPYTMYAPRVLFSGEEEEVDFKSQNILHIQARFFQLPCIFS